MVDLSSESGISIIDHSGGTVRLRIEKDGPQLSLNLLGLGTGAPVSVPFPSVATLSATRDGPSLTLLGGPLSVPLPSATLSATRDGTSLTLLGDAPSLTLHDKAGYSAVLGTGDLVNNKTGETSKTSAASLLMFGKDNHTIWRAP
jgi:hypothetical protein